MHVLKDPRVCGQLTIYGLESSDGEDAQLRYADNDKVGATCASGSCNAHSFPMEHTYYKAAISERWDGWENVKWAPMDEGSSSLGGAKAEGEDETPVEVVTPDVSDVV